MWLPRSGPIAKLLFVFERFHSRLRRIQAAYYWSPPRTQVQPLGPVHTRAHRSSPLQVNRMLSGLHGIQRVAQTTQILVQHWFEYTPRGTYQFGRAGACPMWRGPEKKSPECVRRVETLFSRRDHKWAEASAQQDIRREIFPRHRWRTHETGRVFCAQKAVHFKAISAWWSGPDIGERFCLQFGQTLLGREWIVSESVHWIQQGECSARCCWYYKLLLWFELLQI